MTRVDPAVFWLVAAGDSQFTVRNDPTGDIAGALRQGEPTLTLDDVFGGETTIVVAHIVAWWKEDRDVRVAVHQFRKALKDEERDAVGFDPGND